jgi:hypothetical protein
MTSISRSLHPTIPRKYILVEFIKDKQQSPKKCRTENRPGKHTRAMIIEIEKRFGFVEV